MTDEFDQQAVEGNMQSKMQEMEARLKVLEGWQQDLEALSDLSPNMGDITAGVIRIKDPDTDALRALHSAQKVEISTGVYGYVLYYDPEENVTVYVDSDTGRVCAARGKVMMDGRGITIEGVHRGLSLYSRTENASSDGPKEAHIRLKNGTQSRVPATWGIGNGATRLAIEFLDNLIPDGVFESGSLLPTWTADDPEQVDVLEEVVSPYTENDLWYLSFIGSTTVRSNMLRWYGVGRDGVAQGADINPDDFTRFVPSVTYPDLSDADYDAWDKSADFNAAAAIATFFDAVSDAGAKLSRSTSTRYEGNGKLLINHANTTAAYGDLTFGAADRVLTTFAVNFDNLTGGDQIVIAAIRPAAGNYGCYVTLDRTAGNVLTFSYYDDASASANLGSTAALAAGWHEITMYWQVSTGAGANNGLFRVYVDGVLLGSSTGLDTDTNKPTVTRFGTISATGAPAGDYGMDALAVATQTLAPYTSKSGAKSPISAADFGAVFPTFTSLHLTAAIL